MSSDPLRTGGVTEVRKIASMAGAVGMSIAPHNACGPVGTAVCAHLGAAVHNLAYVEVFDDYVHPQWLQDAFDGLPVVHDGTLALPNGPGLGLTLTPMRYLRGENRQNRRRWDVVERK